jgi:hypothetical protein
MHVARGLQIQECDLGNCAEEQRYLEIQRYPSPSSLQGKRSGGDREEKEYKGESRSTKCQLTEKGGEEADQERSEFTGSGRYTSDDIMLTSPMC